jgi:hypothetical protein
VAALKVKSRLREFITRVDEPVDMEELECESRTGSKKTRKTRSTDLAAKIQPKRKDARDMGVRALNLPSSCWELKLGDGRLSPACALSLAHDVDS